MPINFDCASCGKQYRNVRDEYAGKRLKCKCGHVNRAPSLHPVASESQSDIEGANLTPAPLSSAAPAVTSDPAALEPLVGTSQEESIFGTGESVGLDPASSTSPVSGSYWGKPRIETETEDEVEKEEVDQEERIAKLKRRKTLQKTGPIVTRVCCGIAAVVSFVVFVLMFFSGIAVLVVGNSPQIGQTLSPAAVMAVAMNCFIMAIASCILLLTCGSALKKSFSHSKRVVRSSLPTGKAGAGAMIFAMAAILCSVISAVSLAFHVSSSEAGQVDWVGALLINFAMTSGYLILAAIVYFAGRYRHGSVRLKYLFESDSDSAE